uniref:Uncharacterized protein n=1 Tax=Romanomermis culicivorax TaxID=13658 RepID=A0A915JEM9_ROMCU
MTDLHNLFLKNKSVSKGRKEGNKRQMNRLLCNFLTYNLNDPDYDSSLDAETKPICKLHVPGLDIPWFFDEQV